MPARRYGLWLDPTLAVVALLFVAGSLLYFFSTLISNDKQICQSSVENRAATRLTLDVARNLVLEGELNPGRIDRVNDVFNHFLVSIPPIRCEEGKPVKIERAP